ncbi:hypothetical protein A0H81_15023 [Grifola frondosa]|uniref:Uncharacterized protein n=1 Tax=Grifola frondosa TaxID=5627 RepID=A0A1C7LL50_GRIFR|nr:hypothetical protein A0H81_15023 [Grifola frondosa]
MLAYLSSLPGSLEPPPFTTFTSSSLPHTIIELGSGTGFLAARIARLLHPDTDLLIATDLPSVCPLLQKNLHDLPVVQVQPLAWGNAHHASALATDLGLNIHNSNRPARYPTHILCSDLVYFPALLAPLLRTLLHLTSPPFLSPSTAPPMQVLLSYKIRSLPKETPFWSALGLYFTLTPVLSPSGRFAPSDGDAFILVATRRPESLRWAVPADDRELLGGVGAMGTDTWKEDDQFETMLLMEIGLGLSDDEDGEAA